MASVETLALLTSGCTRYHPAIGVGTPELSRIEYAALLSGLGKQEMLLALAKYLGDIDSERQLIAYTRIYAAGVAAEEQWEVARGRPVIMNIAALAVFEVVRPNRCGKCRGVGYVKSKICCQCNGTGFHALSGRKIADAIGMDEKLYRTVWRRRYERVLRHVQAIDSTVRIAVSNNGRLSNNYIGFDSIVDKSAEMGYIFP